ncbi:SRPBCC family protein [Altererythrobacter sp. H2]|uniref:SRPBCC family protein n=1 Tax=Altererythrobacter sp. H2 TaxID=3108391 RepID=UPI002B4BF460|nr:SRPBCC family protein [Altererythrobacter sp. H2]WRK96922.1 SRPBCC family protein [Altererythrobacter sp. H2]
MTFRTLLATCAALVLSVPAMAEVVQQAPDGFTTRDSVVVKGTPFDVWQTLIAPAGWWNKAHTWSGNPENLYISAQANGCFCELLPPPEGAPETIRRGSAQHMTVVQADPGRVLRMRGGLGPLQSEPAEGVLTIALAPAEGGTRIVWEYVVGGAMRYEVPVIAKAVDGVMSEQLRGLAKALGAVEVQGKTEGENENEKENPGEAEGGPAGKSEAKPSTTAKPAPPAEGKDAKSPKPKVEDAFEDLAGEE